MLSAATICARTKFRFSQFYAIHILLFNTVVPDLLYFNVMQRVFLLLLGSVSVIFSIFDFNVIVNGDANKSGESLFKYENDKNDGIAYWRRVLMCLSSAAALAGALSVFLTSLGRISCFFWGIINCIVYGLYCFAYGYVGSAQLNLIFYLPMQYVGVLQWMDEMQHSEEGAPTENSAVRTRGLTWLQRGLCVVVAGLLTAALYYEIPAISTAITGSYDFDNKPVPRILDALNNGLSVVAQSLMMLRYWESWALWIAINFVQIAMFAGVAGYGVDINIIAMLVFFQANACYGLYMWFQSSPPADRAASTSSGADMPPIGYMKIDHRAKIQRRVEEAEDSNESSMLDSTAGDNVPEYQKPLLEDTDTSCTYNALISSSSTHNSIGNIAAVTTDVSEPVVTSSENKHPAMGIVIGKFYPFHRGHEYLLQTALNHRSASAENSNKDNKTVKANVHLILCYKGEEKPSGEVRFGWITELYPQVIVHRLLDVYDPDDSAVWAQVTLNILENYFTIIQQQHSSSKLSKVNDNGNISVSISSIVRGNGGQHYTTDISAKHSEYKLPPNTTVFTSENYGTPYCRILGCAHCLVDLPRVKVPTSGTAVRGRGIHQWEYISKPQRGYYAMRFVLVGSESTGKTTLTAKLAAHFHTLWVAEYGREYCDERIAANEIKTSDQQVVEDCVSVEWNTGDFLKIAAEQNNREMRLARDCNRLLLCDTDSFATAIWHEHYLGSTEDGVMRLFDEMREQTDFRTRHYFLMDSEGVPFVQDGTRDGEHHRQWMFDRFHSELSRCNLHFTVLRGGYQDREEQAIAKIEELSGIKASELANEQ